MEPRLEVTPVDRKPVDRKPMSLLSSLVAPVSVVALATLTGACELSPSAGQASQVPGPSEGLVGVRVQGLSSREKIDFIELSAEPAHTTRRLQYDSNLALFSGVLVLPAGRQHLRARAMGIGMYGDGGAVLGIGEAEVEVQPQGTSLLVLTIYDAAAPNPQGNTPPVVLSLSADQAEIAPGEPVKLSAVGVDIDGDTLTYAWSDDCGGSFTTPRNARTEWSKGATGACTVTVSVSDAGHVTSSSVELSVSARGDGTIRVEGAFVPRPILRQLGVCKVVLPRLQHVGPYATLYPSSPTPIEGTHFKDSLLIEMIVNDVQLPYEGPRDGGSSTGDGGSLRVAPAVSSIVDDCGGRYEGLPQEDYWRFAGVWTAPSAVDGGGAVLCTLTARVQRGPLSDSFSVAVPVR